MPTDYLYELKEKKGGYVTANEKKVIFRLQDQMGLTPSLINMIVYACFEYDTVLTANLADRIANDWLQQGITTPAEAIAYLKERKNTRKRQYYRAPKRLCVRQLIGRSMKSRIRLREKQCLLKKETEFFANLVKMNRKCCTGGRYF